VSADGPGRASDTRVADARINDAPPGDTEAAVQDAADLGKSAVGAANQPGTTTDEAESRVQEAVEAANEVAERTGGMGEPGRAMNRRSPFYMGLTGAAGVAVTFGLVELLIRTDSDVEQRRPLTECSGSHDAGKLISRIDRVGVEAKAGVARLGAHRRCVTTTGQAP